MSRALPLAVLVLASCASKDAASPHTKNADESDSDVPGADLPGAGTDTDLPGPVDTDEADPPTSVDTSTDTDVASYAALSSVTDGPFTGAWVARSGTRLEVVHLRHEGSPHPVFSHFHDTELGVDCAFRRATDDVMRCLPVGGAPIETVLDDCTTEAVLVHGSCAEVPYAVHEEPTTCGLTPFGVTAITVDPSATTYGSRNLWKGGVCEAHDLSYGNVLAYAEPDPVPPSTFAAGTLQAVATGGDVDVVVVLADDGAVAPLGFYDPVRRVPCRPVEVVGDTPGVARCVPTTDVVALPHAWLNLSEDDTCAATDVVTAQAPCDEDGPDRLLDPASPAVRHLGTEPIRATELVRLEDEVDGGYDEQTDTFGREVCQYRKVRTSAIHGPLRRLGRTLDPRRFPALHRVGVPASGVGVHAWRDAGGRLLLPVERRPFVDDGVPCMLVVDEAGATARCAPLPYAYRGTPSCSDGLVVTFDGPAAAPGTTVLARAHGRSCFGGRTKVADDDRLLVVGQPMHPGFVPGEVVVTSIFTGICRPRTRAEFAEKHDVAEPTWARATEIQGLEGYPRLTVERAP